MKPQPTELEQLKKKIKGLEQTLEQQREKIKRQELWCRAIHARYEALWGLAQETYQRAIPRAAAGRLALADWNRVDFDYDGLRMARFAFPAVEVVINLDHAEDRA